MFEKAKIGDEVEHVRWGKGTVLAGGKNIVVEFRQARDRGFRMTFHLDGRDEHTDNFPSLYWPGLVINPPPQPKKMVNVWQVYFRCQHDDAYFISYDRYTGIPEFLKKHSGVHPIIPGSCHLLPLSVIEVEEDNT